MSEKQSSELVEEVQESGNVPREAETSGERFLRERALEMKLRDSEIRLSTEMEYLARHELLRKRARREELLGCVKGWSRFLNRRERQWEVRYRLAVLFLLLVIVVLLI